MTTAAPDNQCTIEIDTTLPIENVSWYDIWAAAVAINGMCIRIGKTGMAADLGELRLSNNIARCTALTIVHRRKWFPLHQNVGS